MTAAPSWPDATFRRQATRIGCALLQLMADESRWIRRRVESLSLLDARTLRRSVRIDLTIPAVLSDELALAGVLDDQGHPVPRSASRVVLPLALIPKDPLLLGLIVEGNDAEMLTLEQARRLLVPAFADDLRTTSVDLRRSLRLVASVIGDEPEQAEVASKALSVMLKPVHDGGTPPQIAAARRIEGRSGLFVSQTPLLVVVIADSGLPTAVTYAYEQPLGGEPRVSFHEAPLRVDIALSGHPRVRHELELEAPESFEVESAAIYRHGERVVLAASPNMGAGRVVRLAVPAGQRGPLGLVAYLGFAPYGLPIVALIAGALTTLVLLLAAGFSELLGSDLGAGSSGTLLALPALVSTAVIGATSTRVTNRAVSALRGIGLLIALLGLLGGIAIAILGYEKTTRGIDDKDVTTYPALAARSTVLWGLAGAAFLLTVSGPAAAATRERVERNRGDVP